MFAQAMANRKYIFLLLVITIPSLANLSCTDATEPTSQQGGEFKVGAILPLTSDAATYGESCQRGMQVAGGKFDMSITFEDGGGEAKTSVNAFNKLANRNDIDVILGGMFSAPTLAFASIAQEKQVLVLSPTSGSSKVPKTGDYTFSLYPRSADQGRYMANHLKDNSNENINVGVINANEQVYSDIAQGFIDEISNTDRISLSFKEEANPGKRKFRNLISKIKDKSSVRYVFVSGSKQFVVNLIKQSKQRGYEVKYLSQSTLYDESVISNAGSFLEGVKFSGPYFRVGAQQEKVSNFVSKYKSEYKKKPNVWAAYCYDTVMTISKTIRKCEECNIDKLKDSLRIFNGSGLTGPIKFNDIGGAERSFKTYTVSSDSFKVVQ